MFLFHHMHLRVHMFTLVLWQVTERKVVHMNTYRRTDTLEVSNRHNDPVTVKLLPRSHYWFRLPRYGPLAALIGAHISSGV